MVRRLVYVAAIGALTSAIPTRADEKESPLSNRDNAMRFLTKHVIDRTVEGEPQQTRVGGGTLESVSSTRTRFFNLVRTAHGLSFDAEVMLKQTLYEVDQNGRRAEEGTNKDRSFVWRFQVGERLSTGELIGAAFRVDHSGRAAESEDYPFSVYSVQIKAQEETLTLTQSSVLYQDLFAGEGKWRPGIEEIISEFSVENGRLRRNVKIKGFEVDPETLRRTLTDELPQRVEWQLSE